MNSIDIVLLLVITAALALAVRSIIKRKKHKAVCSGNCCGCAGCCAAGTVGRSSAYDVSEKYIRKDMK